MPREEDEAQEPPKSPTVRIRVGTHEFDTPMKSPGIERARSSPVPSADYEHARRHKLPPGYSVQKVIFALWMGSALAATILSLREADESYNELFHIYYQPLIVMSAMLWLWGIAVRVFELMNVRYEVCFSPLEQKYLLGSRQVYQVAAIVSCCVATSGAVFSYHCLHLQLDAAALHPPLMYCLLAVLLLLPAGVLYKETRLFFSYTFFRVITPFREVTFADFLLADILTSLAKALSDSERALCHLAAGPVMQPHSTDQVCGNSSWLIPLGLSLPYAWRFCQCLRVYKDTGAVPQLFNAIKYSTAFPVTAFSYMKYHTDEASWASVYRPLWILAALLNSSYSYFWDVERDWEIQWFTAPASGAVMVAGIKKPILKSLLLYPASFYYYLMGSNLLLRLAWTYKLSPHLRHNHITVLMFALLEVFRRFQWMFVRLEVELRKIQALRPELPSLVPPANAPAHSKVDVEHLLSDAP